MNLPIGTMLFDTAYITDAEYYENHKEDHLDFWRHENGKARAAKGYAKRLFFDAEVKKGWLDIQSDLYNELKKLEAGNGIS